MIQIELRNYLIGVPAVAAIIASRVFPLYIPQEAALPAVHYQLDTTERTYHHTGRSGQYVKRTFSIVCVARTYEEVVELADAVRIALDGKQGSWNAEPIKMVEILDQADEWLAPEDASDVGHFVNILTVRISHNEGVP